MKEKIRLRIISETIKPYGQNRAVALGCENTDGFGDTVEVKAVGTWGTAQYPVSLHFTAYPGCGLPPIGDHLLVTVEREDEPTAVPGDDIRF